MFLTMEVIHTECSDEYGPLYSFVCVCVHTHTHKWVHISGKHMLSDTKKHIQKKKKKWNTTSGLDIEEKEHKYTGSSINEIYMSSTEYLLDIIT